MTDLLRHAPRHGAQRGASRMATIQSKLKRAHASLEVSKKQFEKASVHSWEPSDPAQCVTMAFYSYENALVAAAVGLAYEWQHTHHSKVEVAKKLVKDGKLKTDIGARLAKLNRLRKDVSYGEPGMELSEVSLEDLMGDLESFIDEIDDLLSSLGRKATKGK